MTAPLRVVADVPPLVFEDPPPQWGSRGVWMARLLPLMEHPGVWCNLTATYGVKAHQSSHSHLKAREYDPHPRRHRRAAVHRKYPPGRWEFCRRNVRTPDAALYARYLGPEDDT